MHGNVFTIQIGDTVATWERIKRRKNYIKNGKFYSVLNSRSVNRLLLSSFLSLLRLLFSIFFFMKRVYGFLCTIWRHSQGGVRSFIDEFVLQKTWERTSKNRIFFFDIRGHFWRMKSVEVLYELRKWS